MTGIVGRLWGFCHILRHDGIDYGGYIEQLTAANPRSDASSIYKTSPMR
jgi:type I restriction enzyme M protein